MLNARRLTPASSCRWPSKQKPSILNPQPSTLNPQPSTLNPPRVAPQNELHAASGSPFFDKDPAVVAQRKIAAVPLGRLGGMSEVCDGIVYLLGEGASYITGENLIVGGGLK